MKDAKYLLAYILPLSAIFAVYMQGLWSFTAVLIAFVLLPLIEAFLPQSTLNFSIPEESTRLKNAFFDLLLYLNLPLVYGMVFYYFSTLSTASLATYEVVGLTLSVGIITSSSGINVAHELGHRKTRFEQFLSKVLLLPELYMHFFIEHNRGHHKNVSTDLDSSSARLGESLYPFWWRSVKGVYLGAWRLEKERLNRVGKSAFSVENEMIWFQVIQVLYLLGIGLYFGWMMIPFAVAIAIVGFLQLETVNYVEHYGLRRKKLASGRYENVSPLHSWNSNHALGRIFLYELTRHSDHHFKASRKYQVLRHFDDSPQLPYGYPGSMLLAMLPPLWFKRMNHLVEKFEY